MEAAESVPFMLRVNFTAASLDDQERICECLKLMVDYQLSHPYPGVMMYHFTRP